MDRNSHYEQQYNEIWDVVVKNALIDHSNNYFGQIPAEEEIRLSHDFSPGFHKRMELLLENSHQNQQTESISLGPEEETGSLQLDQSFWEEWKRAAGNTIKQEPPESPIVESGPESAPTCLKPMREESFMEIPDMPLNGVLFTDSVVSNGGTKRKKKWRIRKPFKIAVAFVLIVGMVSTGVMQFEPIRATIMQTVVNFEGQGVLISNTKEDDYHMLFRDPTFIPDGYEIISRFEDENIKWLKYSNGQNTLKIVYSVSKENTEATFDNERHLQNQNPILLKNRYDALIFSPENGNNMKVISWHNGIIQYDIYGCEPQKLLVKIAESMMK